MSRIWRYVLASWNGMAPCVDDGVITLTCCKPIIRRNAEPGDWVIAFAPKRFGAGRIAWAGRVSEVMPLGDYERRHRRRRDAIYRASVTAGGDEILTPLRPDYHASPKLRARDIAGRNALIFSPARFFAPEGIQAPEALTDLAHYFVGQTTKGATPRHIAALERWLRARQLSPA